MQMTGNGITCTGYLYLNPPVQIVTGDCPKTNDGSNSTINLTPSVGKLVKLQLRCSAMPSGNYYQGVNVTLSGSYTVRNDLTQAPNNPTVGAMVQNSYKTIETNYVRYA